MTSLFKRHAEAALVTLLALSTLGPAIVVVGVIAAFGGEAAGETLGLLPGGWLDTHLATLLAAGAVVAFPVVVVGAIWWYRRSLRAVTLYTGLQAS
ncbi:MAG: hypothetical protein RID42_01495 [Alphaproteobacteria bacterium]